MAAKPVSVRRLDERIGTLERTLGSPYSSLPPALVPPTPIPGKGPDGKESKDSGFAGAALALKPAQNITDGLNQIAARLKKIEEKDKALKSLLDKCEALDTLCMLLRGQLTAVHSVFASNF